jgi:hypothetical protein
MLFTLLFIGIRSALWGPALWELPVGFEEFSPVLLGSDEQEAASTALVKGEFLLCVRDSCVDGLRSWTCSFGFCCLPKVAQIKGWVYTHQKRGIWVISWTF